MSTSSPPTPAPPQELNDFLLAGVEDAQNNIRFTESKAGFLAVVMTLAATGLPALPSAKDLLGPTAFRASFTALLQVPDDGTPLGSLLKLLGQSALLASFLLSFAAVVLALRAVAPLIRPAQHLNMDLLPGEAPSCPELFYPVGLSRRPTARELLFNPRADVKLAVSVAQQRSCLSSVSTADLHHTLTEQILVLGYIREIKTRRVGLALNLATWAAVAFVGAFALLFLKSLFNL